MERWLDALNMSLARMYAMPINFYLGLLEGEACHISGGCINTYLRNPIYSTHSLAYKTFSHPMAWWRYRQVDLWCPHSQCKCPPFVGDLLWNDGGHQYALFWHICNTLKFALLKIGLKWFNSVFLCSLKHREKYFFIKLKFIIRFRNFDLAFMLLHIIFVLSGFNFKTQMDSKDLKMPLEIYFGN